MPAIIQCCNLSKTYGNAEVTLLPSVSFSVEVGTMMAIMGPSGCGKSTLLNVLGLIDNASDGLYYLQERNTAELSQEAREKLRRQTFGHIFQQYHLIDHLTVLENVLLPLRYRADLQYLKDKGIALLERFALTDLMLRYPNELSGGQAQRVCIARALITDPPVILADEPTGALDADNSDNVIAMLQMVHEAMATTILLVTHDMEVAKSCSRMYHFNELKVN